MLEINNKKIIRKISYIRNQEIHFQKIQGLKKNQNKHLKIFYLNDNEILTSQNFMCKMQLKPSLWKFLALNAYIRIKSKN